MTRAMSLEEQIQSIIFDVLQAEIPSAETDLIEAGLMDSLGFVDVLTRLEQRFGIRIMLENVDLDQFRSLRGMLDFVSAKLETTAVGPE